MEKERNDWDEAMKSRLSFHTDVEVRGKQYRVALDELPIALPDPFTGKKEPYETMIFPIDKNGNVNYGKEMLAERYADGEEAVSRLKTILKELDKGYHFSEITPQGLTVEAVTLPRSFEGVKLKPGDVIVRNKEKEALFIGKANPEEFKEYVLLDKSKESLEYMTKETVKPYRYLMEGYAKVPGEDGKSMWKAQIMDWRNSPARAMYETAYEHHRDLEENLARQEILMRKERDYFVSEKPFAFTREVSAESITVDRYAPTKKPGVYTHEEEQYKSGKLWKKVQTKPVTMTFDTYIEKAQHEVQQIHKAKDLRLLFYPENTTHMFPPAIREMEKNQAYHSMDLKSKKQMEEALKPKRKGIHRKTSDHGMEM